MLLATLAPTPDAAARDHGDPRPLSAVTAIVIHAVSGPYCAGGAVRLTLAPDRPDDAVVWRERMRAAPIADAHFVIGRDGTIERVIAIDEVANHARGVNPVSIGIELVNDGDGVEPFPPQQIASLETLIRRLRHDIPTVRLENIVRHSDVDQRTCPCGGTTYRRRQDPGAAFPFDAVVAAVRVRSDGHTATDLRRLTGVAPQEACATD